MHANRGNRGNRGTATHVLLGALELLGAEAREHEFEAADRLAEGRGPAKVVDDDLELLERVVLFRPGPVRVDLDRLTNITT